MLRVQSAKRVYLNIQASANFVFLRPGFVTKYMLSYPSYFKSREYRTQVIKILSTLFEEDLCNGDVTSMLLVAPKQLGVGKIICKQDGVLAGIQEMMDFLNQFKNLTIKLNKKDGDNIKNGEIFATMVGNAKDILKIERTVLNLLQRMSGIATLTREFAKKAPGVLITSTRKTFLGPLDKHACVIGGAGTHRLNLSDAVLIKDNHLSLLKNDLNFIFKKLERTKAAGRFIEIEVGNPEQALRVVEIYNKTKFPANVPFVLMLDNMQPLAIKQSIVRLKKYSKKKIYFEASGGINLKNVRAYAKSGVDIISVGALTHSAPALDISLKITPNVI